MVFFAGDEHSRGAMPVPSMVLSDVTNREDGDLRAYLPVTPRKGRTEGGYSGGGHGYAPTTPTPKNASPRVGELSLPRPSLASCSARQRVRSEGSALRPSLATAPRTPRASILELPPEERLERLKALGEPSRRLGRLPEGRTGRPSLGPPQRRRAATVRPGRERGSPSAPEKRPGRRKAPPPGLVRWRI